MDDFSTFVDRVKQANAIEDVIDETGPEWKLARRRGRYLRGDVHDSLVVNVDEGYFVWNDKSEKGDVFNWLELRRGYDFWESLQYLARRAKIEIPVDLAPAGDKTVRLAQGPPVSRSWPARRDIAGSPRNRTPCVAPAS